MTNNQSVNQLFLLIKLQHYLAMPLSCHRINCVHITLLLKSIFIIFIIFHQEGTGRYSIITVILVNIINKVKPIHLGKTLNIYTRNIHTHTHIKPLHDSVSLNVFNSMALYYLVTCRQWWYS